MKKLVLLLALCTPPATAMRCFRRPSSEALMTAATHGNLNRVKDALDRGVGMNHVDDHGEAALHKAAHHGHIAVARLLIEHGADIEHPNNEGKTALHLATRSGYFGVVRLLLDHGANIDPEDDHLWTPLLCAIHDRHCPLTLIRLLIERGADVDRITNDGKTARYLAKKEREDFPEVIQLLEQAAKEDVRKKSRSRVKGIPAGE